MEEITNYLSSTNTDTSDNEETITNKQNQLLQRCKHIPMRLTDSERNLLIVLENALEVCEYTDVVDIVFSYTHNFTEADIRRVVDSVADSNSYYSYNIKPVERALYMLSNFFDQNEALKDFSLDLTTEIMTQLPVLWYYADKDMTTMPYRLADTGQGYQRVQDCPNVGNEMRKILTRVQNRCGKWVGLSVVHLGDRDCIDKLPQLVTDEAFHRYVSEEWGSIANLRLVILTDFFKHGFDGSGDDGGSCIDGRLTSAWNCTVDFRQCNGLLRGGVVGCVITTIARPDIEMSGLDSNILALNELLISIPAVKSQFQLILIALRRKQLHGSHACAKATMEILRNILGSARFNNAEDMLRVVKSVGQELVSAAPCEYTIGNLLDSVFGPICELAQDHIHADECIMVLGHSQVVELFLKAAARKRRFQVVISESAPSLDGHRLANSLSKVSNISITLIPDSGIYALMSRINKVIFSPQAVMADGGAIASCGHAMLTLAAKVEFNIPVYDYIPPEQIDLFVTNNGCHLPSYIFRLLPEYYHINDYNL
eukprot:gene18955-24763_t